jgi:DMSO/TMAO reductase YedYZ molybdopterin-dependent catalytic subunit
MELLPRKLTLRGEPIQPYEGEENMKHNRTVLFVLSIFVLAAIFLAACGPAATPIPTAVTPTAIPPTAVPPTAIPPTATPGPVTLTITGAVNTELKLNDSDLHGMTVVTLNLVHPKNGAADYTGVRLNDLLNKAGIKAGAASVTLTGSDGFTNTLALSTVQACTDCLITFDSATPGVYNAAMPGQSSKSWVKGLVSITVIVPEPVTLTITGLVNNELKLTDSALHGMTVVTLNLVHPKNGATDYTGVRLSELLSKAGIKAGAATVAFTANDGFTNDIDLAIVQACTDCLVAFDPSTPGIYNLAMAGQTSGKAWIKGLVSITIK